MSGSNFSAPLKYLLSGKFIARVPIVAVLCAILGQIAVSSESTSAFTSSSVAQPEPLSSLQNDPSQSAGTVIHMRLIIEWFIVFVTVVLLLLRFCCNCLF